LVFYGKGGIGKSTVVSNLALLLAREGRRALLFGCDPKGDACTNLILFLPDVDRTKRALAALQLVGMENRARHRPSQLSGGQQQRAAIARALVNRPRIIFADEPTGNLDSHTGADIMHLLLSLNQEHGLTLVIVTHDPTIAAQTQRVIRLRDGLIESETSYETLPVIH